MIHFLRTTLLCRWMLVMAVVVLFVVLESKPVAACFCMDTSDPEIARLESSSVFAGRVTAIEPEGRFGEFSVFNNVTIEVSEVWKGSVSTTKNVWVSHSSCDYSFQRGKSYLIYTRKSNNTEHVHICSRTRLLSDGVEDLKALGDGRVPLPLITFQPLSPIAHGQVQLSHQTQPVTLFERIVNPLVGILFTLLSIMSVSLLQIVRWTQRIQN